MVLEAWDDTAEVSYDRALWSELTTLRFVEDANNVLALGPVGVGKTFMATALGHIAVRRRVSVHFERADQLLKRLKASRLDASHDAELRKLIRVDLLVVVERHRRGSTVITSNRDPVEWLAVMADQLLAQSAIDRLSSAAYELVIEGESYRRRQKPRSPGGAEPGGSEPTRRALHKGAGS